ncbi:MAG: phosphate acyltransferase, partial [Limnothrix sp. RL_2_0]|nr:phosphate acyltransferase [Limnothrix sp. RL_2_0]
MSLTRAKIAVDAMGGDHAPEEIIAGAIRAVEELEVEVFLVGDPQIIQKYLDDHVKVTSEFIHVVEAEGVVEMCEEPLVAIRRKPKASINVSMQLVRK